MGHSIRIVCTALVVAFTAGLVATAAGGIVTDRSAVQHTVLATGFDWDSTRPAPPAQR